MSLEDASIPIAGRFQRIENTLERIEVKLDSKASLSDMITLDRRVAALEMKVNADAAVDAALKSSQDNASKLRTAIWGIAISTLMGAAGLIWNIVTSIRN